MIPRRSLLAIAALSLASCTDEPMDAQGQPPWHMWGNSKTLDVSIPVSGAGVAQSEQLVRINYGRPETWSFFFYAKLLEGQADASSVTIDYNLTIGTGRSSVTITSFERFSFSWTAGNTPNGAQRYSTTVLGPSRFGGTPPVLEIQNVLANFPAQDIQLGVVMNGTSLSAGLVARCEIHAYFSPRTHVRPDWYNGDGTQFLGGEIDGK